MTDLRGHDGSEGGTSGCEDDLVRGIRAHHVLRVRGTLGPECHVAKRTVDAVFVQKFIEVIHFFFLQWGRDWINLSVIVALVSRKPRQEGV